jgi:hypothetical protein
VRACAITGPHVVSCDESLVSGAVQMIDHLRQIIPQIEQLPAEQQESYAEILQSTLEADREWDTLFSDPRSEDVLDDLIAQAKQEVRQGKVLSIDEIIEGA